MAKTPRTLSASFDSFEFNDIRQITLHRRLKNENDPGQGYKWVAQAVIAPTVNDGAGSFANGSAFPVEKEIAVGLVTALFTPADFLDFESEFAAKLGGSVDA